MKTVLLAVGGAGGAEKLLSVYRSLVREPEIVVLVHVSRLACSSPGSPRLGVNGQAGETGARPVSQNGPFEDRSEMTLRSCKRELAKSGIVKVKIVVRCGEPTAELLNVAREERADLIIMGDAGRSPFRKRESGSILKAVERSTEVPVLVAKRARRTKITLLDRKENNAHAA